MPHPRAQKYHRGHQNCNSCWKGETCESGGILRDHESQDIKGVGCKKIGLDPGSGRIGAAKSKTIRKSRLRSGQEAKILKMNNMSIKVENWI